MKDKFLILKNSVFNGWSCLLLLVVMVLWLPVRAYAVPERQSSDKCDDLNQAGVSLYYQEKYPDAVQQLERALICYQENDNREGEGEILNNVGFILTRLGQYDEALDYYQQALTIQKELGNREREGRSLNNIGGIYSSQGQPETALDYYQQALTIQKEIGDREGEGQSLNNIGAIFSGRGQYDKALDYYQQALTIQNELGNREGEGQGLNNIGAIFSDQGQYDKALDYYQQALAIQKEIGDLYGEGVGLNNIGLIYNHLGENETALFYFQQALAIQKDINDLEGEGYSLHNIGFIYSDLGQYEAALDYYQQALTTLKKIGDLNSEGTILNSIGGIYDNLGKYETALDYYLQALTIQKETGDREGEDQSLHNIGVIYAHLGQPETALDYYQQALTIQKEIGNHYGEGQSLNRIGSIYESLGQVEIALDSFQQSLNIWQDIGDQAGKAASLHNIGAIYVRLGQTETALDYYNQALAIWREIGDRVGEGYSLNGIGEVYDKLGQDKNALIYYRVALTIRQEIGDSYGEGYSLYNIGGIYDNLRQYEMALDYYQQAIDVFESIRSQAGSEENRAKFIAQYLSLYRTTVDLLNQQGQPEQAFQTMERGRARAFLDAVVTGQVRLRDDDAAKLLTQEQEIHAQRQSIRFELAAAKANTPDRVADLEQQLAKAETAYEEVQDAIAARSAELAALVPGRSADTILGVSQVQPLLDKQTTLVAFYFLEDDILAFILTRDTFETVALGVDPAAVVQQIIAFRDFSNNNMAYLPSTAALYEMLITPLKDKLKTPQLAIIPHQSLHYLPFAALTDGEHYLIDDYTLTVLPSASVLPFIQDNARQTAYTDRPSALILSNPAPADCDTSAPLVNTCTSFDSLRFAEKQAKTIAELYGVEPLIGEAATETAVREQVSQANILHLAAHGLFNPVVPLNSFIALAPDDKNDGWLTVGESYSLNLENTDLVVLSACETNLGDLSAGDELVGLTRALIFAGTPSVIASLWAVDDKSTSILMENFYKHLMAGMSKAQSLQQAQIELREYRDKNGKKPYRNPYYWSAFILNGDGD